MLGILGENSQAGADITYIIPIGVFIAALIYGFFVRKRPTNKV
ncbi:hypothetical protein SAMN02745225_00513 [Ferrithrix thermotolerans DSM 19514]|jgi:hypothetical protein|uniref:Uncharacterized protein n=1 Tax=Ferrithrix thermotolerans DSM 19514 TaxID=1121881 RepID=A0A1M4T5N3_9ACTN|nr:hypothetical protein [Ferrithrix thermotolerans]SHE39853.1 hypothetical protein SAMN02745225_00513 [Ferrithrix thermotolerans DSM 19514]